MICRAIHGVPGYLATDEGGIIGKNGRPLSPHTSLGDGYRRVAIHLEGGRRTSMSVHRLVSMAFHGPPPVGRNDVRHLDGDKSNNRPENLAWGTRKENAADTEAHGRRAEGERHGRRKLTNEQVRSIRAAVASGRTHEDVAREFGVYRSLIGKIHRRENWTHI